MKDENTPTLFHLPFSIFEFAKIGDKVSACEAIAFDKRSQSIKTDTKYLCPSVVKKACEKKSGQILNQQQFVAVALDEAMLHVIHEGANDEQAQPAPVTVVQVFIHFHPRVFVNGEIVQRTI